MYTSSDRRRNVLKPASRIATSRSARVVIRNGSTILIFHGSAHDRCRILSSSRWRNPRGRYHPPVGTSVRGTPTPCQASAVHSPFAGRESGRGSRTIPGRLELPSPRVLELHDTH